MLLGLQQKTQLGQLTSCFGLEYTDWSQTHSWKLFPATGLTLCVLINFDLTSSPNPQVPTGDHIIVLKKGNTIHIWFYLKEKKLKQLDTVGFNKQIDKIVHSLLSAANVTYLELQ